MHQTIADNIAKFGVHLIGVFGDEDGPSFTYTIGLTPKFGVELIMAGLRCEYAAAILNAIAALDALPALNEPNEAFSNLPVKFCRCDRDLDNLHENYVVQADGFYGRPVDVVQVVMCDRSGRFPGEPLFDQAYMGPLQALFFDPAAGAHPSLH